ncbi:MAG: hypothetical protein JWL70_2638 [Acidimicrobiia bacterium]|nr:hypothetical protein [Acidimicrobiia bacterium]
MNTPYEELASIGPYDVEIGAALITMVEPHPGYEIAYNRWYEDDHYYAGALAMPWMFAGRRWVAPSPLRTLRYPHDSPVAQPISEGRYISLYWITKGRTDDHLAWTTSTNKRLRGDGRGFEQRKHVFTSFQNYLGATYRDDAGPRDIHALDYPYQAIVLEVADASGDVEALQQWLQSDYVPSVQRQSAVAQTLLFQPKPLPTTFSDVVDNPGLNRRLTMVHFLDGDPLTDWSGGFGEHGNVVSASGLGELTFCGPFIPTLPGTNVHALD